MSGNEEKPSNVRSIARYRENGAKKDKDKEDEASFDELVEKNRKNAERVKEERLKANKKLVKEIQRDKGKK